MTSGFKFEWDEPKRQVTLKARGLDFADAEAFAFDTAMIAEDTRRNYGEARHQALGLLDGQLVMLVFTRRGQSVRVISLRKANGKEAKKVCPVQSEKPLRLLTKIRLGRLPILHALARWRK